MRYGWMRRAPLFSPCPFLVDDHADDEAQRQDEQNHEDHRQRDHMHRIQLGAIVIGLAADADHAPQHGLHRVEEGSGFHRSLHQLFPPRPATSKKVYESAMVFTSFGSFGSTTNTTGMRRVSPGASVCCVKQKHSTFWKYSPARCGPKLGTACAVTATARSLCTSYSTLVTWPGWTSMWLTSGLKRHGRPCAFESN